MSTILSIIGGSLLYFAFYYISEAPFVILDFPKHYTATVLWKCYHCKVGYYEYIATFLKPLLDLFFYRCILFNAIMITRRPTFF